MRLQRPCHARERQAKPRRRWYEVPGECGRDLLPLSNLFRDGDRSYGLPAWLRGDDDPTGAVLGGGRATSGDCRLR